MTDNETPPALQGFDPAKFEGTWSIVATNYSYWRNRGEPSVTYERLPGDCVTWRDTLRFRKRGLWGGELKPGRLGGIDVQDKMVSSHFVWRGNGILRMIKSPWWVVLVGNDYHWAVTYFAKSNVGTGAGVDLYFRTSNPEPALVADVLTRARAHAFLSPRLAGLFQTAQPRAKPDRYKLT